jgi:ribonucleoside-diphosphate reductase alpha chain
MDGLALSLSIGLQHGVPLKALVDKLINTRFEPSGITQNPDIRFASSVLDYIARWLGGKFISADYLKLNNIPAGDLLASPAPILIASTLEATQPSRLPESLTNKPRDIHEGAPACSECGMLMSPNGACYKCENCGSTSGCS